MTKLHDGIKCEGHRFDRYGCLGFKDFSHAKDYLHKVINNKTKVVYEVSDD